MIRSLRRFDAHAPHDQPATELDLAALLEADFEHTTPAADAMGARWTVTLEIAELVGVLRCLEELAAVYGDTEIAPVVARQTARLRHRAAAARQAHDRPADDPAGVPAGP